MCPSSSINRFPLIRSILNKSCVTITSVVLDSLFIVNNRSSISAAVVGSKPATGSSQSNIFGFSDQDFERICSSKLNKFTDPFQTLGVLKDTPIEEIKKKWKILAMKHHPDRLISQGLPQDLIETNTFNATSISQEDYKTESFSYEKS